MMNYGTRTLVIMSAVVSAVAVTAPAASAWGVQTQYASAAPVANDKTIEGVWRTVVTPRNCQTGDPLGSLPGLFMFNQGGTMSEYGIGPGSSPALRSPGHGVWLRQPGWQQYWFAFTFYRYDATGAFTGSSKITAALELGAGGDQLSTRSVIQILDANDNLMGTACATAAATRFE